MQSGRDLLPAVRIGQRVPPHLAWNRPGLPTEWVRVPEPNSDAMNQGAEPGRVWLDTPGKALHVPGRSSRVPLKALPLRARVRHPTIAAPSTASYPCDSPATSWSGTVSVTLSSHLSAARKSPPQLPSGQFFDVRSLLEHFRTARVKVRESSTSAASTGCGTSLMLPALVLLDPGGSLHGKLRV